ncbi:MAG: M23 family metallopeptidase, partial [Bacteroidales bacterium]|nr:M23 family metallopeptidase [Bacteroidales bacterium]
FGWQMRKDDDGFEFKVSFEIDIKKDGGRFGAFEKELMSKFYEDENSNYHLVCYVMQWCQPVWDEFDDNENPQEGATTENTYIQNADYANMNIHLATSYFDCSGSDLNGGKSYAKMEGCEQFFATKYRGSQDQYPGHSGYDIYVPIGANIFAIRGGKATACVSSSDETHYQERIQWTPLINGARSEVKYIHLSENDRITGRVLTGQIVAKGGRSGNLDWNNAHLPGHTHINLGYYANPADNSMRYTNRLVEENADHFDEWNLKVIPNNNMALMFPCKCQVGHPEHNNGQFFTCNFDSNYATECWAAMELKCPALANRSNAATDDQQIRVIQAQLTYLGYYVGDMDDGFRLDNSNGTNLKTAIEKYKTNNTDDLPIANSNPPVVDVKRATEFNDSEDTDNTITDLLLEWLNNEAPLPSL